MLWYIQNLEGEKVNIWIQTIGLFHHGNFFSLYLVLVIMLPMHLLNFPSGDGIIGLRGLKWYKAEPKEEKK